MSQRTPAHPPTGRGATMVGPVASSSGLGLQPVDAVTIRGGLWQEMQQVNRAVTLREAFRQLEQAGNLHNFRVAAGEEDGEYRGKLYLDSDVYKTLEAVAWEQGRSPSRELDDWQRKVTALISRAQRPDGYLNTFVQITRSDQHRYADLPFGHELFCGGHLIQAGIAQARATGRVGLLDVAGRYADHLVATFGPGRLESTDGHPEIEMALIELYRESGTVDYLDLARFLIDVRGRGVLGDGHFGSAYFQDEHPVRASSLVRGHAVRQVFLSAGVTDLYLETGDSDLLASSVAQWQDMVTHKTYLTGGIGARWEGEAFGKAFELPPDLAYAETCAAHGSILWSWRLLLATGEARYADLIERTLYNAFAPGLSLEGDRFFYVNTLQSRPGVAGDSSRSPEHGRQSWYGTACCPPNVMRTLASLQYYVASHDADGVQLQQYMTGTMTTSVAEGGVTLQTTTGLPWDGQVIVQVEDAPGAEWTLSLRIPSWAAGATGSVNGAAVGEILRPGTYLRLRRVWVPGDAVTLMLPCTPRLTCADPRIDAVRGSVAIERGPLVYAFEQTDQPQGADLDLVELLTDEALHDHWDAGLLGGVATVTARARAVRPTVAIGDLPYGPVSDLPSGPVSDLPTVDAPVIDIVAVPYFRWANRELGAMRVFLPSAVKTASAVATEENR